MKSVLQSLRQPIKAIFGLIIITLAVAVLCICIGQSMALSTITEELEYTFTTVALPARSGYSENQVDGQQSSVMQLSQDMITWVERTARDYPQIIKSTSSIGLASAYIPELTPDNYTQYMYYFPYVKNKEYWLPYELTPRPEGTPYSCAMLEIELLEIGYPEESVSEGYQQDGTYVSVTKNIRVELIGTIENVIALQEGFRDPTGYSAHITLVLPDWATWESMSFEVGERYLVYGMDYYDADWSLRGFITDETNSAEMIEALNPSDMYYCSDEQIKLKQEINPYYYESAYYRYGKQTIGLTPYYAWRMNAVSLTVQDMSTLGTYEWVTCNSDTNGYPTISWDRWYTDENGKQLLATQEEYSARYAVPTIVHLEGSTADFLASQDSALWRQKLEEIHINNHAFPMIGVDKLGSIADFAKSSARVVVGRDFSQEELDSGAQVCIISEHLAALNGLEVGDSINPQFYNYDYSSPYQSFLSDGIGTVNPTAYMYSSTTPFVEDDGEYTIIGLYRQDVLWGNVNQNLYLFTPNTIFVPRASVVSDMDYSDQGFFSTIILENGSVPEFRQLAENAGYGKFFEFYDQGYSEISETFYNYASTSWKVMIVGLGVYGIILTLFLLMYPGSQRKNLSIMATMGADRRKKVHFVVSGSLCILLPGTITGIVIGGLLWQTVTDALTSYAEVPIGFKLDMGQLIGISAVQFILAMGLLYTLAYLMSRERSLMKRT